MTSCTNGNNKKILITGGNGYIGARLSFYLANKGYEVTPLCFPEIPQDASWRNKMAMLLCGDIRDDNFLGKITTNEYDAIVHLVSLDQYQSSGPPSYVSSINITPTWNLLELFSKVGLKKFIYFSTVQVYGKIETKKITEEYPTRTINAYAMTHLTGEQFCDHYNRNSQTKCHVIRLSNSYGAPILAENNCWQLVINDLCRMAYTDQKIVLQSDGLPQRDFIHGWDVVRAVDTILKNNAEQMIFNVSSGTTLTIMETALRVKQIYQSRFSRTVDIFTPMGRIGTFNTKTSPRYVIDNTALKNLDYELEWNLDRGINDLFDYFVNNNYG